MPGSSRSRPRPPHGTAVIEGTVVSGTGRASQLLTPERLATRSVLAGVALVRGTLNVDVRDAEGALVILGEPRRLEEPWCPRGDLALYAVTLRFGRWPDAAYKAFVARSDDSRSRRVIEIMASLHFRTHGARNGNRVTIEAREW